MPPWRISDCAHSVIGSHVGQAFLPDRIGQECPTYFQKVHAYSQSPPSPCPSL